MVTTNSTIAEAAMDSRILCPLAISEIQDTILLSHTGWRTAATH